MGNKAHYYLEKFHDMRSTGSHISWNWAASLLSPAWLFYRKMYVHGVVLLLLNAIVGLLPVEVRLLVQLCVLVVIGLLGNYFYMQHMEQQLATASMNGEWGIQQCVYSKGGTSWPAVIILIVLALVVELIIYL